MSTPVIEISDLTKKYGSYTAVDKLNLSIEKGEVFGLLGPNGAGKSTTILMLMGLSESDSGSVKVCNIDPERNPINVKQKVGYLPEDVGFYDDLTGFENLMYTARLNSVSGIEAQKRSLQLLERVGLSEDMHKKAGKYSRGMRQRLGLADVLIKNPEVIILDEPTLGIDPTGVKAFLELIVQLSKQDGITVLFSSHHLHQVQQVCDRVGIFVKGKLLAEGNVDSLAKQLFNSGAYTIEVGLAANGNSEKTTLLNKVKNIETVESVQVEGDIWRIECTQDISNQISKTIIDSGVGLSHLYKKEYGLDDIYHRYFEGGNEDE
ncbi:ABC transporter ATP-binding protein [Reichenbachiella sp. MALMAid0571]|uniref:ABC transporter ATP-binding protein n=1 Tax=Reichenbachiella sp. MALMAid0571 TaxID=3143939 RepID=UPI0032DEDBF4